MLTDTFTLTVIASAAFVTSIPWLIAYHSQTEWLKEENARLREELGYSHDRRGDLIEDLDDTRTKLAAEKVETENLASTNAMLRKRIDGLTAEIELRTPQHGADGKFVSKLRAA